MTAAMRPTTKDNPSWGSPPHCDQLFLISVYFMLNPSYVFETSYLLSDLLTNRDGNVSLFGDWRQYSVTVFRLTVPVWLYFVLALLAPSQGEGDILKC